MGTSPNGVGTLLLDAMGNKHVVLLGSELPICEAKCTCMLCVQDLQVLLHAHYTIRHHVGYARGPPAAMGGSTQHR